MVTDSTVLAWGRVCRRLFRSRSSTPLGVTRKPEQHMRRPRTGRDTLCSGFQETLVARVGQEDSPAEKMGSSESAWNSSCTSILGEWL